MVQFANHTLQLMLKCYQNISNKINVFRAWPKSLVQNPGLLLAISKKKSAFLPPSKKSNPTKKPGI
jgi:hypothetical protein